MGAVNSLDFDPIEGANIENESGKDRNPIAWRLRIKKGVHIGYGVRYCFAPILPSSWLPSSDSWMNNLKEIVHFHYLILAGAIRLYIFAMEKDEVP